MDHPEEVYVLAKDILRETNGDGRTHGRVLMPRGDWFKKKTLLLQDTLEFYRKMGKRMDAGSLFDAMRTTIYVSDANDDTMRGKRGRQLMPTSALIPRMGVQNDLPFDETVIY